MLDELSLDDLKHQLEEKEQTVATLTEYLEQAAQKLNAVQTAAAAPRPAKAFDPEMVSRQMTLVDSLQNAVNTWDSLQAPQFLEDISGKLDRLRTTILDGLSRNDQADNPYSAETNYDPVPSTIEPSSETEKSSDALGGWEALKAEMLGDAAQPVENEEEEQNIDLKEELAVLVNRPEHIDQDCNDRDAWQQAVNQREKYMISLIRALRVVESRRRAAPDWDSLAEAPLQLREDAAQYSAELQQTLRSSEVELSIERARISRQESLIAQQRREIDKANKKQGSIPKNSNDDAQGGRWLKFLSRGQSDD